MEKRYRGISNQLTQSCRYSTGCLHSCITSIASHKSAVAMVNEAPTKRNRYSSTVRSRWYMNGYFTISWHLKTVTDPPPQSSGVVPLNDSFKTSVPAKYGQISFRTCYSTKLWYKWCCVFKISLNYRHASNKLYDYLLAATFSKDCFHQNRRKPPALSSPPFLLFWVICFDEFQEFISSTHTISNY